MTLIESIFPPVSFNLFTIETKLYPALIERLNILCDELFHIFLTVTLLECGKKLQSYLFHYRIHINQSMGQVFFINNGHGHKR